MGRISQLSVFAALLLVCSLCVSGCEKNQAPKNAEEGATVAKTVSSAPAKGADENSAECGDGEECGGGCNQWDDAAAKVIKRGVPEDAVWADVKVGGMRCGGCERKVIAKVGALAGVLGVEADAEMGQVRIALASDKLETSKKAALNQIRDLGFSVDGETKRK